MFSRSSREGGRGIIAAQAIPYLASHITDGDNDHITIGNAESSDCTPESIVPVLKLHLYRAARKYF